MRRIAITMLVSFVGALQIIIMLPPPSRNHLELLHKRILQSINIIIVVVVHRLLVVLVIVVDCDAINRPVLAITPTTIIISVTTIIIMRMATAVMISITSTLAMSTVSDSSAVSARPVYPASLVLDPDSDNIDDGGLFPLMIRRLV